MPTLPYLTDTSTQLTGTYTASTSALDNFITSNYVSTVSNLLITNINSRQPNLTAATNLVGIGSAITALDYNKITINKPSVFPADMTTIYSKTETNSLLDAKQATLTAATNILGVGSAITALDYNKITLNKPTNFQSDYNTTVINKPTYTSPLSSNLATNTISISLASYSTTGTDTNYVLKTGSTMTGAIVNTSTTTSEFKGIQFAHAARITHIPYIPDGNIYFRAPVIIDNIADYLSFGSRLGDNIIRLYGTTFGFGINDGTLRYNVPAGSVHRFYHGTTNTAWIDDTGRLKATIFEGSGASLTNVPYGSITSVPDFLLKTGGTMTGTLNGTTINATTALQEAGTNLTSKYLQLSGGTLTGTLNGTTIFTTGNVGVGTNNQIASLVVGNIDGDGSDGSIAFSKRQNVGTKRNFKMGMNGDYTFCIGDYGSGNTTANPWSTNYFNIRYADGNVGIGIQGSGSYKLYVDGTTYFNNNSTVNGTLTATTFSGSGASLTNLPLSAYSTTGNDSSYLLKTGGVMSGQITGITTLNATTGIFGSISTTNTTNLNTPQFGVFGGIGDRLILYAGTASVHPYSLGINSAVLWYSVPATASHIFYVAGNPITTISSTGLSTTGLINASTNLQEGGTNLTSKYLKLDGTNTMSGGLKFNNIISTKVISLYDASPANNFQFVGFGNNNGLCINTYQENDAFQFKVGTTSTTSKEVMRIQGNGKVGIGTNDPKTLLHLRGAKPATLKIETNNSDIGEVCCIEFGIPAFLSSRCAKIISTTYGGDKADIQFLTSGNAGTTDSSVRMTIKEDGNIGIGTDTPRSLLHIKGTSPALTIMAQGGTGATTQLNLSTYDHTTNAPNCSLIATDNGTFGATFEIKQKTSGANANAQFTSLSINASGTVNIVNTLQVAGNDINNFLFNNTGRNHSIYQDFNAIDKFGYTYMWAGTNGPGTAGSYYSWYIGLGNEYPFANSVNGYYGMQFAIGRSETYPKLSVRRKENNAWTGWEGLTAERAVSLTAGDKTISGELTVNQSHIAGLRVNGGDTNTLYNYGRDLGLLVNTGQSINFMMWGGNGNIMTVNNSGVVIDVDGVPITIDNKGIIIGTFTNHYYPFVVNRTINGTLSYVFVRTGWNGGSDYNTNSYTGDTSASFAGQIHVSGNILNSSDIRIKKEINDITDDGALQQILSIQPKTYKYIDYLSKNNSTVYGFIAQQVKEVIPHAVELVKDIIPNIYKRAICDSNIITLENDVSQELNINDNIKIYDEFGNDNMYNITEINSNVIKIDKDINTSNIFVFGKEVDDFHTLKKDYIFTLNVCATQELYKLIQKQNEVIEELRNRISVLENN